MKILQRIYFRTRSNPVFCACKGRESARKASKLRRNVDGNHKPESQRRRPFARERLHLPSNILGGLGGEAPQPVGAAGDETSELQFKQREPVRAIARRRNLHALDVADIVGGLGARFEQDGGVGQGRKTPVGIGLGIDRALLDDVADNDVAVGVRRLEDDRVALGPRETARRPRRGSCWWPPRTPCRRSPARPHRSGSRSGWHPGSGLRPSR